jgi:hypothetical protein
MLADSTEEISLPKEVNSVNAVGYFNGTEITITANSIQSSLAGFVNTASPYQFIYSPSVAKSNIYILSYDQASSFTLKKWIFISSEFGGLGYSAPPGLYVEHISPNKEITPISSSSGSVIYKLSD